VPRTRRALASLLLALFSFPLIAPLFAANAASQLPACCRRDGKHHCAMLSGDMESPAPTFQAIRPKCPYYPSTPTFSSEENVAILKSSPATFTSLLSNPAVPAKTEACYRVSFSRSHQKRGPPAQLS
jgi:hypothetical protein